MKSFSTLTVKKIQKETPDCVSIEFEIPSSDQDKFKFKAGQHLTLRSTINNQDIRRSYSICSAPSESILKVGIKEVPLGKFSGFANNKLAEGDTLESMGPDGNFTLKGDDQNGNSYVFFASGSGITPVISLIKDIFYTQEDSEVILFYGNKTTDSIIFKEELEGLKNKYLNRLSLYHILSQEKLDIPIFNGRLNTDKLEKYSKLFFNIQRVKRFFICGPKEMIFELKDALLGLGVEESFIRFELFTSPDDEKYAHLEKTPLNIPDIESIIDIQVDGKSFRVELNSLDKSVLDAALSQGADLPYACKGGVCCTCKAKLLEGEVHMKVNYGLEPDEVESGYILSCQSHPKSDYVKIDFDV